MSAVDTLRSIEFGLQEFRDLAETTGEEALLFFIDMAIEEANDLATDACRPEEAKITSMRRRSFPRSSQYER